MNSAKQKITLRVYGLVCNEGRVLVANELIKYKQYCKFPGGGVEWGESLQEALKREFIEETGLEVNVAEHIYTTDFFIESAFVKGYRVMAVYYKVETKEFDPEKIKSSDPQIISFEWMDIDQSLLQKLSLETDRKAVEQLLK